MTEIICISCWSSFEIDEAALEDASRDVKCPHCGFAQASPQSGDSRPPTTDRDGPQGGAEPPPVPAPATGGEPPPAPATGGGPAAARPMGSGTVSAPAEVPTDDPFAELGDDFGVDEDPEAFAVEGLEIRPEEDDEPEDEPTWRVRTTTGLVLHFPDYPSAATWAKGHEGGGLGIARGDDRFRHWAAFKEAVQEHEDPVRALDAVPPADAGAEATSGPGVQTREAPSVDGAKTGGGETRSPAPSSPQQPKSRSTQRHRASQRTGDFTFRTAKASSVWADRVLYLAVGVLLGGGVVYYLSWLGMMPGIRE